MMTLQQALQDAKKLSKKERAELVHSLLNSLEEGQDDNVEQAWLDVANQRLKELESGEQDAVSWEDIKSSY
ncbi:addiction module protein [Litoribrevibacter euphylliae]|uniref:Addiction module protein n=1 Tax=Litoribrevibacter euphylliae TaxID=1834034 RepID=A0ABV7H9M7_9GAMM